MTSYTNALLTAGPRTIGPWGDRLWRIGFAAQYVTGSSSDYWLVSTNDASPTVADFESLVVPSPDETGVLDSILYLLAMQVGDPAVEQFLIEHHNVEIVAGRRVPVEFWELTDRTRVQLASLLAQQFRLGLTLMEDSCLVSDRVISELKKLGFEVDVFQLREEALVP